jgi:hypothetical protein
MGNWGEFKETKYQLSTFAFDFLIGKVAQIVDSHVKMD